MTTGSCFWFNLVPLLTYFIAFESTVDELVLMGWFVMKCPEFTASQFDLYFALFAADIYRNLMLFSCNEKNYVESCCSSQCSHMLWSSPLCNELVHSWCRRWRTKGQKTSPKKNKKRRMSSPHTHHILSSHRFKYISYDLLQQNFNHDELDASWCKHKSQIEAKKNTIKRRFSRSNREASAKWNKKHQRWKKKPCDWIVLKPQQLRENYESKLLYVLIAKLNSNVWPYLSVYIKLLMCWTSINDCFSYKRQSSWAEIE